MRSRQAQRRDRPRDPERLHARHALHPSALVRSQQLDDLISQHDDLLRLARAEVSVHRGVDSARFLQREIVQVHHRSAPRSVRPRARRSVRPRADVHPSRGRVRAPRLAAIERRARRNAVGRIRFVT